MTVFANITPSPANDGIVYASASQIPTSEGDVFNGAGVDPFPSLWGAAVVFEVKLVVSGSPVTNQTYLVLQCDIGLGVWIDIAWMVWTGVTGTITGLLSGGFNVANSYQQTRPVDTSPASSGANQIPLGGNIRLVGKSTFVGGLVPKVLVTAEYKILPVGGGAGPDIPPAPPAPSRLGATSIGAGANIRTIYPLIARIAGPSLLSLSPSSATAGDVDTPLAVTGTNFASTVRFNGTLLSTVFVNSSHLTATIPAALLAAYGNAAITVLNGDGGISNAMTFAVNNTVPVLTSISPTNENQGTGDTSITLTGTFNTSSEAYFNGTLLVTSYVNSTTLTATVTAAMMVAAGSFPITVQNPSPGGGSSSPVTFTVNAGSVLPLSGFTVPSDNPDLQFGDTFAPSIGGSPPALAPKIGAATPSVGPGNVVHISGTLSNSTTFKVYGQTTNGNALLTHLTSDGSSTGCITGYPRNNVASAILPATLPKNSLYVIWGEDTNGVGGGWIVNRAELWRAFPAYECIGYGVAFGVGGQVGGVMRVIGNNLAYSHSQSTSTVTPGTGSKSFTTWVGLNYAANAVVFIYDLTHTRQWMKGTVTSYNSGTGVLVVNVTSSTGGSTASSLWNIVGDCNVYLQRPSGGGAFAATTMVTPGSVEFTIPSGLATIGLSNNSYLFTSGTASNISWTTTAPLGLAAGDIFKIEYAGIAVPGFAGGVGRVNTCVGTALNFDLLSSFNIGIGSGSNWNIYPQVNVWVNNGKGGKGYGWSQVPLAFYLVSAFDWAVSSVNLADYSDSTHTAKPCGTSVTSNTITSSGSKSFKTQAGLGFSGAMKIFAVDTTAGTGYYCAGTLSSYTDNGDGSWQCVFTSSECRGSGSSISWDLATDTTVPMIAAITAAQVGVPATVNIAAGTFYFAATPGTFGGGNGVPIAVKGAGQAATILKPLPTFDSSPFSCFFNFGGVHDLAQDLTFDLAIATTTTRIATISNSLVLKNVTTKRYDPGNSYATNTVSYGTGNKTWTVNALPALDETVNIYDQTHDGAGMSGTVASYTYNGDNTYDLTINVTASNTLGNPNSSSWQLRWLECNPVLCTYAYGVKAYGGSAGQATIFTVVADHCDVYCGDSVDGAYGANGAGNLSLTFCTAQNDTGKFSRGRFFVSFFAPVYDSYFFACQTFDLSPTFGHDDQNAGETLLIADGPLLWQAAYAVSSSGASLTMSGSSSQSPGAYAGEMAVVARGPGIGQSAVIQTDAWPALSLDRSWFVPVTSDSLVEIVKASNRQIIFGCNLQGHPNWGSSSSAVSFFAGGTEFNFIGNYVSQMLYGVAMWSYTPQYWGSINYNIFSKCIYGFRMVDLGPVNGEAETMFGISCIGNTFVDDLPRTTSTTTISFSNGSPIFTVPNGLLGMTTSHLSVLMTAYDPVTGAYLVGNSEAYTDNGDGTSQLTLTVQQVVSLGHSSSSNWVIAFQAAPIFMPDSQTVMGLDCVSFDTCVFSGMTIGVYEYFIVSINPVTGHGTNFIISSCTITGDSTPASTLIIHYAAYVETQIGNTVSGFVGA